ncbi:MAG: NADH-quinone oxidoreductase subunit [Frankiaceae bacterium]|nr:NADH-quinone oxidoreductase subunit [Frankiaceae bacterium]
MSIVLQAIGDKDVFTAPSVSYKALAPMLIVFGTGVVGIAAEAFTPRVYRWATQAFIAIAGLVAALIALVSFRIPSMVTAGTSVVEDGPAKFLQGSILLLAIVSLLFLAERSSDTNGSAFVAQAVNVPGSREELSLGVVASPHSEVFPLAIFAIGGMLLFPAAHDLVTLFVALEVLSLPLYLLCGLARRRRLLSQEAAMKYFLLGAFSSGFFLYGTALLYGFARSTDLGKIRDAVAMSGSNDGLLYAGLALLVVGLLFKVSAVPFQAWTPDVYQGAPTPVTALMAACTKVAAFGALMRVVYVAAGPLKWDWRPVFWAVAILTMVVGALMALTQTDVKRMLAYSSIAHAGFLLTGVIATTNSGISGTLFYLIAYGFPTIGAFVIVSLVRDADGEATHLSKWRGLGKRSPVVAGMFALFLLALAGIPMTSGFFGKYAVFAAAAGDGAMPVVIVGVLASAIAGFFYLRVVVLMFFHEPSDVGPTVALPGALTSGALAIGVAVTVILGVMPGPLLDIARHSTPFLQ